MTDKEFRELADIVLYGDFDDKTIEYLWSTDSLVEAIERYKKIFAN